MRKTLVIFLSISGVVSINLLGFIVTSRLSGGITDVIKFLPSIFASTMSSSIALFIALMNLIKNPRIEWDIHHSLVSWKLIFELNISNLNDQKLCIASIHSKYFTFSKLEGEDEVGPFKVASLKYEMTPVGSRRPCEGGLPTINKTIKIYVIHWFEGSSKRFRKSFEIINPYLK